MRVMSMDRGRALLCAAAVTGCHAVSEESRLQPRGSMSTNERHKRCRCSTKRQSLHSTQQQLRQGKNGDDTLFTGECVGKRFGKSTREAGTESRAAAAWQARGCDGLRSAPRPSPSGSMWHDTRRVYECPPYCSALFTDVLLSI